MQGGDKDYRCVRRRCSSGQPGGGGVECGEVNGPPAPRHNNLVVCCVVSLLEDFFELTRARRRENVSGRDK